MEVSEHTYGWCAYYSSFVFAGVLSFCCPSCYMCFLAHEMGECIFATCFYTLYSCQWWHFLGPVGCLPFTICPNWALITMRAKLRTKHGIIVSLRYRLTCFPLSVWTRSSPQWSSSRSTTAHIVFDLRSLILGFGESCTIVQGTNLEPENVLSNVLYWQFRRSPNVWLQFRRRIFRPPPDLGEIRGVGVGIGPWFPISSPLTYTVYLIPFWSYLAGSKSVSVRPSDPYTMPIAALYKPLLRRAAKGFSVYI